MLTQKKQTLTKYKDLEIEVSRMWKVRTKFVLVVIAELATIKKQTLHLLPGQPLATYLQKITLMSMVYINL
jgi:hypothetical protein